MYIPGPFGGIEDSAVRELLRRHPFATLITIDENRPIISHLPLLAEWEASASHPALRGHCARANPHWRHFGNEAHSLAIFHGPHGYISPTWYGERGVPTWNYAVVHVSGPVRLLDAAETEAVVDRLTARFDPVLAPSWESEDAKAWKAGLLGGIVGFALEAKDVQAKFKLSQNRSGHVRQRIVAALNDQAPATDELAALMMAAMAGPAP